MIIPSTAAAGMMPFSGPMNGALEFYQDTANIAAYREMAAQSAEELAIQNLSISKELIESLSLESGNWRGALGIEYLQDQRAAVNMMQRTALDILQQVEQDLGPHFADIVANGNETVNFFMGNHWSDADQKHIIGKGLKPYSWPSFRPLVNAVHGEYIAQRGDYRTVAMNERSERRSALASKAMRWYAQSNGLTNVKSDLAFDSLVYGFSVAGTGNHPMRPMNAVQTVRCRPQEFYVDLNSATDCTFANTKFVLRKTFVDRVRLAAEFPEWADQILNPTSLLIATTGFEHDHATARPKAKVPVGQNRVTGEYDPSTRAIYARMLLRRELYIRRWTPRLVITDPFEGKTYPCRNQDEAEAQRYELEQYYIANGLFESLTPELREIIFQACPAQVEIVDQLIFIGDQLVRVNSDSEGGLPYTFCAPDFHDGDLTPYFDHAKGPQRWEDRLMADIDDQKAGGKGGIVVDTSKVQNGENISGEALRNRFYESNWVLPVNSGDDPNFDARKVATYVKPNGTQADFAALLNYAQSMNLRAYGGPNSIGMSAFAGQSGKSADELRRAGSVLTRNVFDKIAYADCQLGRRALYCLGTLHPATLMRTYGEDLRPEFFSMMTAGVQSLADYDFDIELYEVIASPSEKQARIREIRELLSYYPALIEHALPFYLKNAEIDYDERQAMIAGVAQDRQARAQAAQRDYEMRKSELESKLRMNDEKMYLAGRAQALAEMNLPKVAIGMKVAPGPMGMTDFLNWAAMNVPGFSADPNMVIADQTARALIQQGVLTMQQVEEWNNMAPEQKEALMNQVKFKRGYPTAEDAGNRATREVRSDHAA